MKKIVIDMDDVICGNGFLNLVNQFLNANYTDKDTKGYYVQDLVPKDKKEEWNQYFKEHNLYDYVNMLENADKVIKKLNEKYEVYILSTYVLREWPEFSGEFVKYKYEWLYENLPFIDPNRYIFTTNKSIIECDIRIDDKLSNLEGKAEKKILFTSYHNQEYTKEELEKANVIKVENWKEVEKLLLS